MKKLVSLILAAMMLLCATAALADEDITIAGIVFKDEYTMKMVQQGYEDAAKDYGVNILIGNSMGDIANEQALIQNYVDMGVKGIAITPYSEEASIPMLKSAYEQGVEVAVANIKLNNAEFVCGGFTSQDYLNGQSLGQFMAPVFEERFGKENALQIAIIDFDAAIPEQSQARYNGFLDALTEAGFKFEIVAQQSSTSKQDNVPIIEAMLTGAPSCQIFYNTSAAFTSVAVQVVKSMGLSDQITVVGYDMGEQVASQLLENGTPLYCTLEQDMYTMGYKAVEQIVKTLRGEPTECERGNTVYLAGKIHSVQDLAGVQDWLDNYYVLSAR